jgi:hypothetical protein
VDGRWVGGVGGGGGRGGYRVEVIPGGKLPMVIVSEWSLLSIEALDEVWSIALGQYSWEWNRLSLDHYKSAIECCVACPTC